MIEQARKQVATDALPGQIRFEQSPAESLPFIKDGSVDLVVAGMSTVLLSSNFVIFTVSIAQASHWFDWSKLWPEASRILRKDGILAVWVIHIAFNHVRSFSD